MTYDDRLALIQNLTIEEIIADCKRNTPERYRNCPFRHPELNHGLDLLVSDETLDCYMAAYGEMHLSKCRAVLQNIPYPPKVIQYPSQDLEIIDWGCGQGIGAMSVVNFLKDRELLMWLKRITLIEPSSAALNRAVINLRHFTNNGVTVEAINEYLPSIDSNGDLNGISYHHNFVIHVFSNILDVAGIDFKGLAKCIEDPARTHYILCTGPINANAFRIDRFCEIFQPSVFFSNISNKCYGRTSDTNYCYSCKTKGFEYHGTAPDFSRYNPGEQAALPIYGEYDLNLQVQNKVMSQVQTAVFIRLQEILSPYDILYIKPDINGAKPDFIILRPNVGIMIVSVFEEDLSICQLDSNLRQVRINRHNAEPQIIESPYNLLETSQSLILESIKEFSEAVVENSRNLGLVKKVLICSKGSRQECIASFGDANYVTILGSDFLSNPSVAQRLFNETQFYYRTEYFNDIVVNRLKRTISPQWHTFSEGEHITLSSPQKRLSQSREGARQKISGVAGSGKTQVLATRAVNAQIRTGGDILILTFNIALVNYMKMRIGKIRADFPWDKIHIDHYHRFFRRHANQHRLHLAMNSYDSEDFFSSINDDELFKYDAIFIDEVQDFQSSWLHIIYRHFLKPGGEFVVFGDPKQDIYHRGKDAQGNVLLGIIPGRWNQELSTGHRFTNPSLANLATDFQHEFFEPTNGISRISLANSPNNEFKFNLLCYTNIEDADQQEKTNVYSRIYELCLQFINQYHLNPEKVAILAPQEQIIQSIDFRYRTDTGHQTTVTFVKQETKDRLLNRYPAQSFQFENDYDRMGKVNKYSFTVDTPHLKLSTIQSFKGWETETVICIIQNDNLADKTVINSDELVYTAITRAIENLLIINIGETPYNEFWTDHLTLFHP